MLRVRQIRAQAGLTQSELAQLVQCERSFISKIETGQANPTQAVLERIARALHVPVSQLFDEPPPSAKNSAAHG